MTDPNNGVVADTQILVWYVLDTARLSRAATNVLETAVEAGAPIRVSAYSLIELGYAVEKHVGGLTEDDRAAILHVLNDPQTPFDVVPVDATIANRVHEVPREVSRDPGDRTIVATAEVLGLPLVSADTRFDSLTSTEVIWR